MSMLAYNNIFLDPSGDTVTYSDEGGTFATSPPLSNLSIMQLPIFAEFTGATAEFDAETGSTETARVFALLGHTLVDGMEVEFLADDVSLGVVTIENHRGLPQHAILALDSDTTFDVLTVSITGGVAATKYTIGSLWASSVFEVIVEAGGFAYGMHSLSQVDYVNGTGYAGVRDSYESQNLSFASDSHEEALGPAYPNMRAVLREIGRHSPVIAIPFADELSRSIYALLDGFNGPKLRGGTVWRTSAIAREQV